MFFTLIVVMVLVVMVLEVCAYVQIHQIIYNKNVQGCVCVYQLCMPR